MAETEETVSKRTLSEAELAARRANAQKSTGPKNTDRSRFNRLTHGLRATLPLPDESQDARDQRLSEWMDYFAPTDSVVTLLVQRAVELTLKLDRGDVVEEALSDQLVLAALDEGSGSQGEVEKLAGQLVKGGAATLRLLRKSSVGCVWLQSQWAILVQELVRHKRLVSTSRERVLLLLGRRKSDVLSGDPLAIKWLTVLLGAGYDATHDKAELFKTEIGRKATSKLHPSELDVRIKELAAAVPSQAQSLAQLCAYIDETLADLKTQLEAVHELEEEKRAVALRRAQIDLAEEGKQLLRYQASHNGSLQATLRRIDALQNPRQPRPPGRPKKIKPEVVTTDTNSVGPATTGTAPTTDIAVENSAAATTEAKTDIPLENPAATTTEAKTDIPLENPAATTTEAKTDIPLENPAATTTEAKTDISLENPAATTTEAKTDIPLENPTATTTEAKTEICSKTRPPRRPKLRPTFCSKTQPRRRPKRRPMSRCHPNAIPRSQRRDTRRRPAIRGGLRGKRSSDGWTR